MSQGNETENKKKSKQSRQRFAFERVYGRDASQQELFEETVRPSIVSAIEGYNVTVFAYGQTGTGKTYTMEGHMEDTEKAGIIPRSVYSVFDILESTCLPGDYTVTVSHLEIYQEELHDLLSPHNEAESLTARLSKKRYTTSLALAQAMQKKGIQMTYDPKTNKASGKYSKRRRSNVAVILVRIIFISSFLFYCLLLNHSFPTNPNSVTNFFKLFSLLQLYNYIAPASLF